MAVNAFTLFGTLQLDSSKFQRALTAAEKELQTTQKLLNNVEKATVSAGQTSATSSRQFEKLNNSLSGQKQQLKAVIDAYTSGKMSATQFGSALLGVAKASDRVKNSAKDLAAKVEDTARKMEAAAKRTANAVDREAKRAAREAEKAAQATARAVEKAAKDAERAAKKAAKEITDAEKKAAAEVRRIIAETNRQRRQQAALGNAVGRQLIAVSGRIVAAERAQELATRRLTQEKKKAAEAMGKFGARMGGVGDTLKSVGSEITMLISGPLLLLGAAALQSAIQIDALNNSLMAVTGSPEIAAEKFEQFIELARTSPGVFATSAAAIYSSFKSMDGVTDSTITKMIKGMGRLSLSSLVTFDPQVFALNLQQMFTQGFEMIDVKEAITKFPFLGRIFEKAFNLEGQDRDTLQQGLQKLYKEGKLTIEEFFKRFGDAIENDPILGKMEETLGNKLLKSLERIKISLKPLGDAIGRALEPALLRVEAIVERLSQRFKDLGEEGQNSITKIAAAVAGLGIAIAAIGGVVTLLAGLIKWLAWVKGAFAAAFAGITIASIKAVAVPLLKIIAIIALVAAAVALLYKAYQTNFGGIQAFVTDVVNVLTYVWTDFYTWLSNETSQFIQELTSIWEQHKDDLEVIVSVLKVALTGILVLLTFLIVGLVVIVKRIAMAIIAIVLNLVKAVAGALGGLSEIISGILKVLAGIFTLNWSLIKEGVVDILMGLWRIIVNIFDGIVGSIIQAFTALIPGLESWGDSVANWFAWLGGRAGAQFKNQAQAQMRGSETLDGKLVNGVVVPKKSDLNYQELPPTPKTTSMLGSPKSSGKGQKQSPEDQLAEKLKDLRFEYQRILASQIENRIERERALASIDLEKDGLSKLAKATEYLNEVEKNATEEARGEAVKNLNAFLAEQDDNIRNLVASNKDLTLSEKLANELLNLKLDGYELLDDKEKESVQNKLRALLATEDLIEAEKKAIETQKDYISQQDSIADSLRKFIDMAIPEMTNVEQLEQFIMLTELAGNKIPETFKNAALAGAEFADKNEAIKTGLETIKTLMGDLGLATEPTLTAMERLSVIFASMPDALAEMAKSLGITTEALRTMLEAAALEEDKPTIFGQIRKGMDELRASLPTMEEAIADTAVTSLQELGSVFATAVSNWDGTAKSFFQSIAQGFQRMAQQIIQQLIEIMIWRLLAGLGLGAASGSTTATPASAADVARIGPTLAAGGLITGPGSGTSDSIPAMLSNGEFVMPANVVKKLGVGFFESLRQMKMPRPLQMAAGGYAGMMPTMPALANAGGSSVQTNNMTFNIAGQSDPRATASMVQRNVLQALKREEARNR